MTETTTDLMVDGFCAEGFGAVRDEFERNFRLRAELGASVCVRVGGATVVDLWGGVADADVGRPWDRDTVSVIFSATKGAASTCIHLLAGRGEIDLERPVAAYWPEFARKGKDQVTVHDVLTHRSGVLAIRAPLPAGAFFDAELMADLIAAEAPFFPPGQQQGYAAMTYGYILDALVRRTDGRSLGRYFADELAGPLGLDFWIGAPPQIEPRIAPILLPEIDPTTAAEFFLLTADPESIPGLQFGNSGGYLTPGQHNFNSREAHGAEIPSGGGIANARALAGLYEPLAFPGVDHNGVCFDSAAVAWMSTAHSAGWDHTLRHNFRLGLGYMLSVDNRWRPERRQDSLLLGSDAFGHTGFGGCVGFADPAHGMSFGYTMNRMSSAVTIGRRGQSLIDAAYYCLGLGSTDSGSWR
ncbi:MAG TPA: serine hydrolase domain-containing protein [Sporichthyaceae bacterium]|jgi:CubicO group peptidase (beta-lactamase class C family)|nr:serine hydrolase domain-containing protein [Sporichthyaceae bacterium]